MEVQNPFFFLKKKCVIPKSIHQRLFTTFETPSSVTFATNKNFDEPLNTISLPQETNFMEDTTNQERLIPISVVKKQLKEELIIMENQIRENFIQDFRAQLEDIRNHDKEAEKLAQTQPSSYIW